MRNGTADASNTSSHDTMLHYKHLIDIAMSKYNLLRSLKGGGTIPANAAPPYPLPGVVSVTSGWAQSVLVLPLGGRRGQRSVAAVR